MADDKDLTPEEIKQAEDQKEIDAKLQERIDKIVDEKVAAAREEWKEEQVKSEQSEPEEGDKNYVDPDWQPGANEGWNKVFSKGAEISREIAREEFKRIREEEKEELDRINKDFDNQLNELREGGADIDKKTEKEIFKLGVKLGSTNIKELYGVYKGMKAIKKDTEVERTLNLAEKASQVGSRSTPEKGKKQKSYADIASKSFDDLVDEEFGE